MARNFTQIVISTDTFAQWLSLTNQMANAYKNVVTTATNTAGDTTSGNAFVSGILGGNSVVVNYQMRGGTVETAANLAIVSNVTITAANSTFVSNVYFNSSNVTMNSNTFAITGLGGGNSITISSNAEGTNTRIFANTLYVQGNTTIANSTTFSNSVTVTGALNVSNVVNFSDNSLGSNSVTVSSTTANVVDSFSGTTFRGGKYVISVKDNTNSVYQMTELLLMHDGSTGYTTEYATLRHVSNNLVVFSANIAGSTVRLWATPTVANSTYKISRNLLEV
jgi:hypothetical protein